MGQFSLDLSRIIKKARGNADLVVRKVMLETFSRVVLKSPVDTGRFRGNWIIGYGGPNRKTTTAVDPGGAVTIGKITQEVQVADVEDTSTFLTNSLHYSIRLENGYSKQAPEGMVALTLTEITAKYGR